MNKQHTLAQFANLLVSHGAEVSPSAVLGATQRRELTLLAELLERGGSSNAKDEKGLTALMSAAQFDDVQALKLLLRMKADVSSTDSSGLSALQWAIATESQNAANLLVSYGATVPAGWVHGCGLDELQSEPYTANELVSDVSQGAPKREQGVAKTYMAQGLIHLTLSGVRVRSKSELLIADTLVHLHVPFDYELPYFGIRARGMKLPDFSFRTIKEQKIVIWEHLGMMANERYREKWYQKKDWYLTNGLIPEFTLFESADDCSGGLDSQMILQTVNKIKTIIGLN